MKIKLLKPYSMFSANEIVEFDNPVADLLILRKIAEPYKEEKKKFLRVKDANEQTVERLPIKG